MTTGSQNHSIAEHCREIKFEYIFFFLFIHGYYNSCHLHCTHCLSTHHCNSVYPASSKASLLRSVYRYIPRHVKEKQLHNYLEKPKLQLHLNKWWTIERMEFDLEQVVDKRHNKGSLLIKGLHEGTIHLFCLFSMNQNSI